jgi:cytochrome P450
MSITRRQQLEWTAGAADAPPPPMLRELSLDEASRFFLRGYERLGPVYRLPFPERSLTVLAGTAANMFAARHGDRFFTTKEFWTEFDSASERPDRNCVRDGAANKQQRGAETRSFSRRRIIGQLPRLVEIARESSRHWLPGESIVVLPAMQRIVVDQLGQVLARRRAGDYLPDLVRYLDTTVAVSLSLGGGDRSALATPEYLRAKERIAELGRSILAEHLETPASERETDLVDDVLAMAGDRPEQYSQAGLSHAALVPLLVGLQTVSNTVSFFLYGVLKHPVVRERVLAEVDAAFADGPLVWEKLEKMRSLRGAMMETLRMYPVAYGHVARVAEPLTVEGYRLEPGDDVFVAMTVPHYLPELFPDPDTFDIDRFDPPRNEHNQPGAFAPFGLGSHTCLGAGIAEVQLMVIVAALLRTFRLELDPPDAVLKVEHTPVPTAGAGLRIRVVDRRG